MVSFEAGMFLNMLGWLFPTVFFVLVLISVIQHVIKHNINDIVSFFTKHGELWITIVSIIGMSVPVYQIGTAINSIFYFLTLFSLSMVLFCMAYIALQRATQLDGDGTWVLDDDKAWLHFYDVLYCVFHVVIGIIPGIIGYLMFFVSAAYQVGQLQGAKTIQFCIKYRNQEE